MPPADDHALGHHAPLHQRLAELELDPAGSGTVDQRQTVLSGQDRYRMRTLVHDLDPHRQREACTAANGIWVKRANKCEWVTWVTGHKI